MQHSFFWTAAVSAIACGIAGASPAGAQPAQSPIPPNPQIETHYIQPTKNQALMPIYQALKDRKVLEILQQFLAPLKLPAGKKLVVQFNECDGATSVPYEHGGPVTICYEYVAAIEKLVPAADITLVQGTIRPEATRAGPVIQAVLHDVALGVFDMLDLPVWGRVDDAADRVSAFIMLQFGPDVAWNTIAGSAWFLSGTANTAPPDFSAVSGVIAQRYYTTLCIAFGAEMYNVTTIPFRNFVAQPGNVAAGDLPMSRAVSCPAEYDTVKQAFIKLFVQQQHIDPALLQQVQQTNWVNILFGGG